MRVRRLIAPLLCLAAALMCAHAARAVDPALQYIALAPSSHAENGAASPLSQAVERLSATADDWKNMVYSWCAVTEKRGAVLRGALNRVCAARLTGLYGDRGALPFQPLLAGRWPYAEELLGGARVIVLSERLAASLFGGVDALGLSVEINQSAYSVIGVYRHAGGMDGADGCAALAPLVALDRDGLDMDALTVWAIPSPGEGAATGFGGGMNNWLPGGALISLSKERARALLPLRMLYLLAGCALLRVGVYLYKKYALALRTGDQLALQTRYAADMLPRLALTACVRAGGLLALLVAGLALLYGATRVLFAFPEWIPPSPAQWRSIVETFRDANPATLLELRTPQLLTLRLYQRALYALCAVLAFMLARSGAFCARPRG